MSVVCGMHVTSWHVVRIGSRCSFEHCIPDAPIESSFLSVLPPYPLTSHSQSRMNDLVQNRENFRTDLVQDSSAESSADQEIYEKKTLEGVEKSPEAY